VKRDGADEWGSVFDPPPEADHASVASAPVLSAAGLVPAVRLSRRSGGVPNRQARDA